MDIQEMTSVEKHKKKKVRKPTRIQMIKFGIGVVTGICIYLIIKLIF